jgi:hypothetical protein
MIVRYFRNIWFALAAFLWLPAVAHCQLEALTGLAFLQCHEEASDSHSSSKDCTDCCAVEKSQFRSVQLRFSAPSPELLLIVPAFLPQPKTVLLPPGHPLERTSAAPDLPQRWHFLSRTALPVRAPSLVS